MNSCHILRIGHIEVDITSPSNDGSLARTLESSGEIVDPYMDFSDSESDQSGTI